jgi:hypothetical protein
LNPDHAAWTAYPRQSQLISCPEISWMHSSS